ncbi:hypothetical protein Tco_1145311 [Tanacetum coccineum]
MLFQPLFDEFLNPSPSVDHPAPKVVAPINEVIAPVLADSIGSPSSTTVDQDAPSPSNDPYFGVLIPEVSSDKSSSSDSIHTIEQSSNSTRGYRQEVGIDFEESCALVARLRGYKDIFSDVFDALMNMVRIPNGCEDCVLNES